MKLKGLVKWFDEFKGIGEVYSQETKSIYFVIFPKTRQINPGFNTLKEKQRIIFNINKHGLVTEYFKLSSEVSL
jgi:cold shock CspA family protein